MQYYPLRTVIMDGTGFPFIHKNLITDINVCFWWPWSNYKYTEVYFSSSSSLFHPWWRRENGPKIKYTKNLNLPASWADSNLPLASLPSLKPNLCCCSSTRIKTSGTKLPFCPTFCTNIKVTGVCRIEEWRRHDVTSLFSEVRTTLVLYWVWSRYITTIEMSRKK